MNALIISLLASLAAPDRVVVFPDRAQVTRVTTITCGNRVPVVFEGIPPAASSESFRARVTQGSVDGLRAEWVTKEKEYSAQAQTVTAQLDALRLERVALDDRASLSRAQAATANRYNELALQAIAREMAAEKPDTKAWQAALETASSANSAAIKTDAEITAKLRELQHQEDELNLKLEGLRVATEKHSWTVEILASCQGASAELELTYLVGGASWTPAYEARADEGASAVELSTWATLNQSTGEDWNQVALVLSTAVPSQNATPPELMKLIVQGYEKPPEKKVLVRRDEAVEHARSRSVSDEIAPSGATVPLAPKSQGLSVQLAVPEKARVPGNNTPIRLFVGKSRLAATFQVRALPKLFPFAFRIAEVNNQAAWPLLPGTIDAFRATGLVGRYALERVAQGAPFTITFGVDDSVRVKRTAIEELKRDTGLFNDKKRFTYAYRFELANYGKAALDVSLADHIPVSELNDITVAVSEKTTPGYQLNAPDGIAQWKVSLRPGEKKTVDLAFRVDVPTSYDLGGL